MRERLWLFNVVFALAVCCSHASAGWSDNDDEAGSYGTALAVSAGYNTLQQGFVGYTPNAALGVDWYLLPDEAPYNVPDCDLWKEDLFYRISFDYFPMSVPSGNYGTSEDIAGLSGDVLFYAYRGKAVNIFLGIGVGYFLDAISVDTPATGRMSSQYYYFAAKPSLGLTYKISDNYDLIPEVRSYWMYTVNNYFTVNTVYQLALCRRFK